MLRRFTCRRRQSGVALITILLVFALATVIAQTVMTRNFRDIRRTANLIGDRQAYYYALAGEAFARQILYRDFVEQMSRGEQADGAEDGWAQELQPFDIDGGEMTIDIVDAQSLFNLNSLVGAGGSADPEAVAGFRRLSEQVSVTEDYSYRIADWIDRDTVTPGGGSEDAGYQQGYLPANHPLLDKSELRLIAGMNSDDYFALRPFVIALPATIDGRDTGATKYNINTVSATLLQALSGMSAFEVQDVVDVQQRGGLPRLEEWLASSSGAALRSISGQLSVASAFFEVRVRAQYQGRLCLLTSLIYRSPTSGELTVLKRQLGQE